MTQVTVLNGQTIFDIALQCCGDIGAAYDIAVLNDIEVTSYPAVGVSLEIPDAANRNAVRYYDHNKIKPSSVFMFNPYNLSSMSLRVKNPNYDLSKGDYTSEALQLDGSFAAAQAEFTDLTGTGFEAKLQESIDGTVWGDVPNSTKALSAGAAPAVMWNIPCLPAGMFLRVKLSTNSNTGYFTAFKLLSNMKLSD